MSLIKWGVEDGLNRRAEAYLVRVHQAERTGGAKNEVEIQATVADPIKGARRVGDGLSFTRVSDSGAWDLPGRSGTLFYVFLNRDAEGPAVVDSQDPRAVYSHTDELQRLVARFKRERNTRGSRQ